MDWDRRYCLEFFALRLPLSQAFTKELQFEIWHFLAMNDDNNEDNEDDADAKPVLLHVGRDKQGGAPHRRPPIRCPGHG